MTTDDDKGRFLALLSCFSIVLTLELLEEDEVEEEEEVLVGLEVELESDLDNDLDMFCGHSCRLLY